MMVTRKQVAAYAGVSESTVSYVINNGPRPVSDKTRKKVLEAIAALGYQPNAIARSLRRRRTTIIGLIVPDTANPFYGEIARVIENACDGFGYAVMVCNTGQNAKRLQRYLTQLTANQVAGMMFIPDHDEQATTEAFQFLRKSSIPSIILDCPTDLLPSITANQVEMGYIATRHLIDLGHCRIAYVARNVRDSEADRPSRFIGYQRTLAEVGIDFDPTLMIAVGEHPEDGEEAAHQLLRLSERPTAVFAHNDMNALGVIKAAREHGLCVPDDLSVVGCDNVSVGAYVEPSLTTVGYSVSNLGMRAVERLVAAIEETEVNPCDEHELLRPTLIVRGSTAPLGGG